jgi:hypothetical protein
MIGQREKVQAQGFRVQGFGFNVSLEFLNPDH